MLNELGGPWIAAGAMATMLAIFAAAVWSLLASGRSTARFAPEQVGDQGAPPSLRAGAPKAADSIDRYLLPQKRRERWQVQRLLNRAGYSNGGALRWFYLIRVASAAIGVSVALIGSLTLLPSVAGSGAFGNRINLLLLLVIVALVAGFYGPLVFVRWRAAARQTMIRRGFPDALDLLQVMIEAGLGLDAAMQRVGTEMSSACPPLADEINLLVLELRAGKARDQALQDFARRIDVDYVRAFTIVLNQSLRFGTSGSHALEVFAADMRNARMMAAEKKANKLPVQMSVVLVVFMLPAVMTVALGPVVIRAIRVIFPELG